MRRRPSLRVSAAVSRAEGSSRKGRWSRSGLCHQHSKHAMKCQKPNVARYLSVHAILGIHIGRARPLSHGRESPSVPRPGAGSDKPEDSRAPQQPSAQGSGLQFEAPTPTRQLATGGGHTAEAKRSREKIMPARLRTNRRMIRVPRCPRHPNATAKTSRRR